MTDDQKRDHKTSADQPGARATERATARIGRDLGPRVVSGIVLAAAVIAITLAGQLPVAMLMAVIGGVVAWEWGRIVRGTDADVVMAAHAGTVIAAVVLAYTALPGLAVLAIAIGMILVALLSFGRHSILSATGVAYAAMPAVALIWLRSDEPLGATAVLFVIVVVAAADTLAYFTGRLLGGPKLWPRISPNKTWAGFGGAVMGGAIAGALTAWWIAGASTAWLVLLGAGMAVIAQAGDLAESALKRKFGAKDASALIPGHGGFMDRIDGLVTAAVAAAIIAALSNVYAPAHALLLGRL